MPLVIAPEKEQPARLMKRKQKAVFAFCLLLLGGGFQITLAQEEPVIPLSHSLEVVKNDNYLELPPDVPAANNWWFQIGLRTMAE
jgi:hypothetical protein